MKLIKYGLIALALVSTAATANIDIASKKQKDSAVLESYERLLPLEGGSNFRDMGGYKTSDGKTVRRGLLFRSGVMTSLTPADEEYLSQFGFDTIVDLRSNEERDLYPNLWAEHADIDYVFVDYGFADLIKKRSDDIPTGNGPKLYGQMPYSLKAQLRNYFDAALAGSAPLVVNCSAGQDRTGIASALMLTTLGVPRSQIMQDYVLSTEYRRPVVERGDIDLAAKADKNPFAAIMLRYSGKEATRATPLITEEGIPYLYYALEQIENDYGSVAAYMDKELGVDAKDAETLKALYLQ